MAAELFEKKYRIGKLIGEGGMGVVHEAIHVYSKARVAIKRIAGDVAGPDLGERLLRESTALAVLIHSNIVRLYDAGVTDDGDVYIVMELIHGDSLRKLIRSAAKRGTRVPLHLVLHVMAQVAEAMDFAHRKGFLHRDLKPENIMVEEGSLAKVLDFGLVRAPDASRDPAHPRTNPANVIGTPNYMAPEQVQARELDGRTDIYAFGVVLYEAISGRRPYDGHEDATTSVTEILAHHVFAEPTPIRLIVPSVPMRVWRIIERCLAKAPADRYATMGEVAREVRAALREIIEQAREEREVEAHAIEASRVARETEPMRPVQPGAAPARVLPFESPAPTPAPAPLEPRVVRETEPMAPAYIARGELPFTAPASKPLLGKGHTMKIAVAALPRADAREPLALEPAPEEMRAPEAPAANEEHRSEPDAGRGPTPSSSVGFVFDPTWPTAPTGNDHSASTGPTLITTPAHAAAPAVKPRGLTNRSLAAATIGGLALAVSGMLAVMIVSSPRAVSAPGAGTTTPIAAPPPTSTPAPIATPPATGSIDVPAPRPSSTAPAGAPPLAPTAPAAAKPTGAVRRPKPKPAAAPAATPRVEPVLNLPPKSPRMFGSEP